MSAIAKKWLAEKDPKFRDEAQSLLERMTADAGNAKVSVDRHGILGFGESADGYPLVALTVRKDGLRLYANTFELAKHKAALGRDSHGQELRHAQARVGYPRQAAEQDRQGLACRQGVGCEVAVGRFASPPPSRGMLIAPSALRIACVCKPEQASPVRPPRSRPRISRCPSW